MIASAILRGGCAVMQLRAKKAGAGDMLRLARSLRALCRDHGVPFVVNDRPDVALLAEADGVHLGQEDLPIDVVRAIAPSLAIGVSTHDLAQAGAAERAGADLIGFGPVWPTQTKENPSPIVGLNLLAEVVRTVRIPVVAIGGVDEKRALEVARTGASYAAVIRAICAADDPERAARTIHAAWSA